MRLNAKLLNVAKAAGKNPEFLRINYTAAEEFNNLLKKLLTDEIESAILRGESEERLTAPDYAVVQAHDVGYRKGLRFVLSLLDTKETKDND